MIEAKKARPAQGHTPNIYEQYHEVKEQRDDLLAAAEALQVAFIRANSDHGSLTGGMVQAMLDLREACSGCSCCEIKTQAEKTPDRIWAWMTVGGRSVWVDKAIGDKSGISTEYVRADLYADLLAAAEALLESSTPIPDDLEPFAPMDLSGKRRGEYITRKRAADVDRGLLPILRAAIARAKKGVG